VNADGSNLTNLTDGFTDSTHASWSPDGTKIAFQSDIGEVLDMDVFVVNVDGTHPVNLSNHRGWDAGPWWSPDGSQILFNTVRDGNFEIYSMNVDGSNPLDLTNHPADDNSGTWLDTSPTLVSPEDKLIMTWGQVKHGNR
jgi:Tol biopolymer transport system component